MRMIYFTIFRRQIHSLRIQAVPYISTLTIVRERESVFRLGCRLCVCARYIQCVCFVYVYEAPRLLRVQLIECMPICGKIEFKQRCESGLYMRISFHTIYDCVWRIGIYAAFVPYRNSTSSSSNRTGAAREPFTQTECCSLCLIAAPLSSLAAPAQHISHIVSARLKHRLIVWSGVD